MKYLIGLVSLITVFVTSCKHKAAHDEEISTYTVSLPEQKDTTLEKEYIGQIRAIQHIDLRAIDGGYLQKVNVDEGQFVKKGQLLFQLMPAVYESEQLKAQAEQQKSQAELQKSQAELQKSQAEQQKSQAEVNKAQAEVNKAQAELNKAEIEYQNTKILADKNIVSQNELALLKANLEQTKANLEQTKANLEQAKANLEQSKAGIEQAKAGIEQAKAGYNKAGAELKLAGVHLKFTEIRAPFDGIVGRFNDVRLGSLAEEGELLTTLSDNSKMWVYFNVPEAVYLDFMRKNNSHLQKQPVRLKMSDGKFFEFPGEVETIESDFNNETGNIAFRATFANPKELLRHGQTGNIYMPFEVKDAILLPQKATFEVLDKKFVYVVKNGIIDARQITIGNEVPHLYQVISGLTAQDTVLMDGLRKVKKGDKIKTKFVSQSEIIKELLQIKAE